MGDILIEVVWPQDGLPDDIKLFSEGNRRWIDITSPMMVTRQQAWAEGQRHSQDNAALRSLVESLEEVKAEQKALIEADGERMEAARCALHKGNARCTGEGKQEAIIAALDAIGWEASDA